MSEAGWGTAERMPEVKAAPAFQLHPEHHSMQKNGPSSAKSGKLKVWIVMFAT